MAVELMVRRFHRSDAKQCRDLWRELTEWHREIYEDPSIGGEYPENYFDEHLAKVGPENLWVATIDSKIVGLVGLMQKGDEFEIEPLVVGKAYRSKGIGTRLVEKIVAEARKRSLKLLNVSPVARNAKTIKFLYKAGFQNLGYIQLFMDFTNHKWKDGPKLFGCKFRF